jgi:hypothetical protein
MNEDEKNYFNPLYTLGEAQYSGRNLRVTVFYSFLLRGRITSINLQKLFVRSN